MMDHVILSHGTDGNHRFLVRDPNENVLVKIAPQHGWARSDDAHAAFTDIVDVLMTERDRAILSMVEKAGYHVPYENVIQAWEKSEFKEMPIHLKDEEKGYWCLEADKWQHVIIQCLSNLKPFVQDVRDFNCEAMCIAADANRLGTNACGFVMRPDGTSFNILVVHDKSVENHVNLKMVAIDPTEEDPITERVPEAFSEKGTPREWYLLDQTGQRDSFYSEDYGRFFL